MTGDALEALRPAARSTTARTSIRPMLTSTIGCRDGACARRRRLEAESRRRRGGERRGGRAASAGARRCDSGGTAVGGSLRAGRARRAPRAPRSPRGRAEPSGAARRDVVPLTPQLPSARSCAAPGPSRWRRCHAIRSLVRRATVPSTGSVARARAVQRSRSADPGACRAARQRHAEGTSPAAPDAALIPRRVGSIETASVPASGGGDVGAATTSRSRLFAVQLRGGCPSRGGARFCQARRATPAADARHPRCHGFATAGWRRIHSWPDQLEIALAPERRSARGSPPPSSRTPRRACAPRAGSGTPRRRSRARRTRRCRGSSWCRARRPGRRDAGERPPAGPVGQLPLGKSRAPPPARHPAATARRPPRCADRSASPQDRHARARHLETRRRDHVVAVRRPQLQDVVASLDRRSRHRHRRER